MISVTLISAASETASVTTQIANNTFMVKDDRKMGENENGGKKRHFMAKAMFAHPSTRIDQTRLSIVNWCLFRRLNTKFSLNSHSYQIHGRFA